MGPPAQLVSWRLLVTLPAKEEKQTRAGFRVQAVDVLSADNEQVVCKHSGRDTAHCHLHANPDPRPGGGQGAAPPPSALGWCGPLTDDVKNVKNETR